MTITVLLIAFAIIALFLVTFWSARGRRLGSDEVELTRQIRPVDLEAFRNLTDPTEEQFLREHLSEREFRTIQRERLRAAVEYVGGVSHNAGILLRLAQAARQSPDLKVAEAGQKLLDDALRLRLNSILVGIKLRVELAMPGRAFQPSGIVDRYQQVTELAVRLGRMQYPDRGGLLSKAL